MRNLKRVLSLALAAIMLMGMMVMGTSAKDISEFPDADQIDDYAREAVAITTGLGIFAGEAGTGKFNPNGTVTRAQLATIICKILVLEGTVDYDLLKGSEHSFPDAKTYQGGWAEGYINFCQSTNIVRGYPNGTFGADDDVITWHAALALERAIGYYRDNEKNGEALDETVVTSKGIEIGLYGDMSLSINHVLTRQELAVMVYNALFAQRVVYSADRKDYVKYNNYNVVPNNSTVDPENTLAYGTFYLRAEDGVVMSNSATDPSLAGSDMVGASTMVDMYDDDHKLTGVERSFEYETGTDLIGHAVTVYYSEAHKVKNTTVPEKVYAMIDQTTATGMITYATLSDGTMDYTTMNRSAVSQGFKTRSLGVDVEKYNINYALDTTVGQTIFKKDGVEVEKGDYILLISNKANKEIDYAIVLKQYADEITVNEDRFGDLNYSIGTLSINDFYREDALENKDKIIVTPNFFDGAGNPKYAVVQKAPTLAADVTEISGKSVLQNSYKTITADGTVYTESPTLTPGKVGTAFQAVTQLGETTLVLDRFGQLIAISQSSEKQSTELVYVSQFGYKYGNISSLKDQIVLTAEIWHVDGTSEIITVNTDYTRIAWSTDHYEVTQNTPSRGAAYWTDASIIAALGSGTTSTNDTISIENNYKNLNAAGKEPNANNTTLGTDEDKVNPGYDNGGTFLGVWNIRLREEDGTYILTKPNTYKDGGAATTAGARNAADITQNTYTLNVLKTKVPATEVHIAKNHSTFLPKSTYNQGATLEGWANAYTSVDTMLRQTNSTYYFMVDGVYGEAGFSVKAIKGVQDVDNIALHGNPGDTDGTWAEEAWLKDNNEVLAMVIHGASAVDDLGVCYYNQGSYTIAARNGKYAVIFLAYDAAGNPVNFTYEFDTVEKARDAAKGTGNLVNPNTLTTNGIPSGYYTFYSNKVVALSGNDRNGASKYAVDDATNKNLEILNGDSLKGTVYVANGTLTGVTSEIKTGGAKYNLFTTASGQGFLYSNARVIDLKTGTYTTVDGLYKAVDGGVIKNVRLSYSYSRTNYESAVLFLIDYDFTSEAPTTPTKPSTASTGIDYSTDPDDVQVYTTDSTAIKAEEAAQMIRDDLEKQGYTVKVTLASGTWTYSCEKNGMPVAEYKFTSSGSKANAVKYTVDKVEVVGSTTYAAPTNEYVKKVSGSTTTYETGSSIAVTDGVEITTGYVKVTTSGDKLANVEVDSAGTNYYALKTTAVAAKDDPAVTATVKGTYYKDLNGTNSYFAYTANKTYGDLTASSGVVDVDIGYFKVTAPGFSKTPVNGVTLTNATIAAGSEYAKVNGTVTVTVDYKADKDCTATSVKLPTVAADAPYSLTTASGSPISAGDSTNDTTGQIKITVTIKATIADNVTIAGDIDLQ